MKVLATTGLVVGTLLVLIAVVCFFAAIWVVGPNSMRLAGTGTLALMVGAFLGFLGTLWLETRGDRR